MPHHLGLYRTLPPRNMAIPAVSTRTRIAGAFLQNSITIFASYDSSIFSFVERLKGIGPLSTGWKPVALPLSYNRVLSVEGYLITFSKYITVDDYLLAVFLEDKLPTVLYFNLVYIFPCTYSVRSKPCNCASAYIFVTTSEGDCKHNQKKCSEYTLHSNILSVLKVVVVSLYM
jgi:hypothetical protein